MIINNTPVLIKKYMKSFKFTFISFIYFFILTYFQTSSFKIPFVIAISLMAIMHFISKSRKFAVVSVILFSLLITFEAFFAFFYHSRIPDGIFFSIMETNPTEAKSVMIDIWIKGVILFSFTFFLILFSVQELKKNCNFSIKWSGLFLFVLLFIAYPCYIFFKKDLRTGFFNKYEISPSWACHSEIKERLPVIWGTISSYIMYLKESNELKKYLDNDRILPVGISLNDTVVSPQKIFFIIGESACRRNMSIYGYHVKTTPFLDSLHNVSPNLIIYNDAISPGCLTRHVIGFLTTFASPANMNPLHEQKNIIELANVAGYQSLWISAQDARGIYESFTSIISSFSQYLHYPDPTKRSDDLDLIPVIQEQYNKKVKQFFVINLFGSHIKYSDRYDNFDKIQIEDFYENVDYDRTIHHTDRVLREIYKIIEKDTSSIIYYISDHGECLKLKGHGFINGSISQFEVPMLFINQTGVDIHQIADKYYMVGNERINTLSSIYILAELMGYSVMDETVQNVREHSEFIYHADGRSYSFSKLVESESVK